VKLRKLRKLTQGAIRHHCAWGWSFDKFVRAVVEVNNRYSAHLQKALGDSLALKVERKGQTVVTTGEGAAMFSLRVTSTE
jgi:hypothetical protein